MTNQKTLEKYNWWKEEVLKKKFSNDEGLLSRCVKNLNNGKIKFKDFIIEETNYLPEDCRMLERLYHIVYDLKEPVKCKHCGVEPVKFISFFQGYLKFCSQRCGTLNEETQIKYKESSIENHGVDHWAKSDEGREKLSNKQKELHSDEERKQDIIYRRRKTYYDRTGYWHQMRNPEVIIKFMKTMNKNHGVDFPLQSQIILNNCQLTNLIRYGSICTLMNSEVDKKSKNTNLKKWGVEHWTKSEDGKLFLREIGLEQYREQIESELQSLKIELYDNVEYQNAAYPHIWHCLVCNNTFRTNRNNIQQGYKCPFCYPRSPGTSVAEKEISEFLFSNEVNNYPNKRNIIPPKEIDIYIPDYNLAIEFDGLYWHSDKLLTDKNYHINKTIECEENGIRLIHIFEDEWIFKKDIIKEILKQILNLNQNKVRIHSRKCEIRKINSKDKNEFLDKYHLQGGDKSTVKLGAFFNNELVSVMTFSKSNISRSFKEKEGIWELSRFCSNYNYHIPGIAGKLLEYFKRNYDWKQINTFSDRRWSNGDLYYKLGFDFSHNTEPNYWYIYNCRRIHRFTLRKRENEPENISEWVLRFNEGYSRIWDCGNMKFVLRKE